MATITITEYHAHVYFSELTHKTALELHRQLGEVFGGKIRRYTLSEGPRGPHITRMFGIDIPIELMEKVVNFLICHRGPHPILIHPVTGNELMDHTQHALWLGEKQPLNLSVLDD